MSRIMEDIISRVTQSQRQQLLRYSLFQNIYGYGDDTISYYLPTFEHLTERRRTGQTIHSQNSLSIEGRRPMVDADGRRRPSTTDDDDDERRAMPMPMLPIEQ